MLCATFIVNSTYDLRTVRIRTWMCRMIVLFLRFVASFGIFSLYRTIEAPIWAYRHSARITGRRWKWSWWPPMSGKCFQIPSNTSTDPICMNLFNKTIMETIAKMAFPLKQGGLRTNYQLLRIPPRVDKWTPFLASHGFHFSHSLFAYLAKLFYCYCFNGRGKLRNRALQLSAPSRSNVHVLYSWPKRIAEGKISNFVGLEKRVRTASPNRAHGTV